MLTFMTFNSKRMKQKTILTILFCSLLLQTMTTSNMLAKPVKQLFNTTTLTMYVLDINSGAKDPSDLLCNSTPITQISYGCTAYPEDTTRPYPFNSNTITINIEGDTQNGVQLGYLHNVTPHEVALTTSSQGNKPLSCVKAQAIAARTFAYYHLQQGSTINNSSDYQVYVPYLHDTLNTAQQQRVDTAVSEILYMTVSGSTAPIRAHYGEDNAEWTTAGTASYLKAVHDPISAAYGNDSGTGFGGMSSKGCSRWSFGHTSSRGPVTVNAPSYPHDSHGDGKFWSIQHNNALQILTHYYSDIVIRNHSGQIVTPTSRWVPLAVDWGTDSFNPPPMNPDAITNVVISLQNSGTSAWTNDYWFSYQWVGPNGISNGSTEVAAGSITEGSAVATTLPVRAPATAGLYTLRLDMVHENGGYFHQREAGRPWFTLDFAVCVGSQCHRLFLPTLHKGNGSPSNPDNCQWSSDNLLQDGGFNNLPHPYWTEINVFDSNPNSKDLSTLRTTANSWPGNNPWSAVLGGINDIDTNGDNQDDHDLFEHAVFQLITFPANVEKVALEYSYYLTTTESPSTTAWDKFFVDLQLGGLGLNNSLLGQPIKYANTHPYQDIWRRRGEALEDGGDGQLIISDMAQYAGAALYVVFYSEVDTNNPSTFYLDALKLKGCSSN